MQSARPMQHATIYREGDMWVCDCVNDWTAADCRQLFGTTAIPMPYRRVATEATVRAGLERRNPGITITRGTDR